MASSAREGNGNAPTLGDLLENWVTERFPYEYADKQFFDHVGEKGTPIQVKGTQKWIKDGYRNGDQKWRRGRFKVWQGDHKSLKDNDGIYLLIIYEADEPETCDDLDILGWEIITPETLENTIDGWWDVDNTRCAVKGETRRINWRQLMDESEVDDGSRR